MQRLVRLKPYAKFASKFVVRLFARVSRCVKSKTIYFWPLPQTELNRTEQNILQNCVKSRETFARTKVCDQEAVVT